MNSFSKIILSGLGILLSVISLSAQTRVKDVARVLGARENQLLGYGLVVGLDGKGDSEAVLLRQSMANMMKKFGLNLDQRDIKSKNAAVVMVTAKLGPFARNGSKLDIEVASFADAKSLQGGTLLQTPLMGADGNVYAVGQGSVSIGGFLAGTGGASLQKNHPTVGKIPGGALVEREVPTSLLQNGYVEVVLRDSDFTSAVRLANAVNEQIGPMAEAASSSTVKIYVPQEAQNEQRMMEFIARVENVIFRPDVPARIVINEKTGTIVANSKIRIDSVAVAQGNLTVSIVRTQNVSQPNPFTGNVVGDLQGGSGGSGGSGGEAAAGVPGTPEAPLIIGGNVVYEDTAGKQIQVPLGTAPPEGFKVKMIPATTQAGVPSPGASGGAGGNVNVAPGAQTVVTTQDTTNVEEEKKNFVVIEELPTIQEVAAALNALGVTPRDMMSIFQTMKEAGALQAELILQ